MSTVTVVGTGYVGLVTGASLADLGHRVVCLDIDKEKIDSLRLGKIPFYEPGLQELVERGVESNRLSFETSYELALKESSYCFLALPTPSTQHDHCDLQYVLAAAKQVASNLTHEIVIINKSTVPVGTATKVVEEFQRELDTRGIFIPFDVVSNPEFLREGSAVRDFREPKRILLGVSNKRAEGKMRALYSPFADKIVITDIASSELTKYAANAMLAMRLTMINSFSQLCEKFGADIEAVRSALGKDPRIGDQYLKPGIGFGGSCLPKDVRAIKAVFKDVDLNPVLFEEILRINEQQKNQFFDKIVNALGGLEGKSLAVWGLAFKPNTDDLREAPSLDLCRKFLNAGARLKIFDPVAMKKASSLFSETDAITFCDSEIDCASRCDAIVLMTEWPRFSRLNFREIGSLMNSKVFFDGRNQFTGGSLTREGFDYYPIGIKPQKQVIYHDV